MTQDLIASGITTVLQLFALKAIFHVAQNKLTLLYDENYLIDSDYLKNFKILNEIVFEKSFVECIFEFLFPFFELTDQKAKLHLNRELELKKT